MASNRLSEEMLREEETGKQEHLREKDVHSSPSRSTRGRKEQRPVTIQLDLRLGESELRVSFSFSLSLSLFSLYSGL